MGAVGGALAFPAAPGCRHDQERNGRGRGLSITACHGARIMLKRMAIAHRLMLFLPILLAVLAVTVGFALFEQDRSLVNDRKQELKNLVEVARDVIKTWRDRQVSGELTEKQAQEGAREQLFRVRFADKNYFFIQRYDGVTILLTERKEWDQGRLEAEDPNGVFKVK